MFRCARNPLFSMGLFLALALVILPAQYSLSWAQAAPKSHSYSDSWGPEGLSVVRQGGDGLQLNFSITSWQLEQALVNNQQTNVVRLPGVLLPNDAGAPDLPGISQYLAVPNGATVVARIVDARKETYYGVDLAPAPIIPLDTEKGPLVYAKDFEIYAKDLDYPAQPMQVGDIEPIRGVTAAMLGITPFQYNPIQQTLTVYRDLKVEITFEGGTGSFGQDRLRSPWFQPILDNLFLNSSSLASVTEAVDMDKAGSRTPDFEYVIITPTVPSYMAWADTLRRFRSEQGIRTGVFTTQDIGGNNTFAIESFIDDAYNNWDVPPVAVLLMADHGLGADQIVAPVYDAYCISDNIYADVSGNNMPDLALARMAASNPTDLETFIRKVMDYEINPSMRADFYNKPIIAGGWQTDRWFVLCDEVVYGFLANTFGMTPTREYAIYEGTPDVWSHATNTQAVLDHFGPDGLGYLPATPDHLTDWGANATRMNNSINGGAFMLMHRDHGSTDGWSEPDYRTHDLGGLTNDELPFVFSVNCHTGKFDEQQTVFAEALHRHEHGALGVIAATEESFSFVNDTYIWGMMDHVWPQFDPSYGVPGDHSFLPAFASVSGKYYLAASSWPYNTEHKEVTYYLFHHHGDAFTTVQTAVPTELMVAHNASLISGLEFFEVTADAGALVGLSVGGQLLGSAISDGSPLVIDIPSQLPGQDLVVTVTKQNHLRYRRHVPIVPAGGPFVVYDTHTVNDATANGNGQLDFAEEATLNINLHNVGLDTAIGVSAVISSDDPYLTILDDSQFYGDIDPDGYLNQNDGFRVQLAAGVPDGYQVPVSLTATDADSSYISGFQITAHAPVMVISDFGIFDDPDADGVLDPGEEALLQVELVNAGTAPAANAVFGLSSLNPNISIAPYNPTLPEMEAGQNTVWEWTVTATEATPIGEEAEFELSVTADNFNHTDTLALTLGLSVEDFETGTLLAYPWLPAGDADWFVTELMPGEGVYSARSGIITDSQQSSMSVTVDVVSPGDISFLAKVSCEGSWDYMRFYIDDTPVGQWSGNFGWEEVSYPINAGTRVFTWTYFKDNSNAAGNDCAWVDYIVFPPIVSAPRPSATASPGSLSLSLEKPQTETRLLNLSNTGEGELNYEVAVYLGEVPQSSVPEKRFKKDQVDDREGQAPQKNQKGQGGPDGYGYWWRDSDDPEGPVYDWVEINAVGTVAGTGDDAILGPFDLGFEFPYYGQLQDQLRVCTNGWLSFTSTSTSYNNGGLPNGSEPNNLLAVFWDDLNASSGGDIYYYADTANNRFIVEFDGVYHFGTTVPLSFQVIINADGSIVYQYKSVTGVNECTVGIENGAGNDGLQVVFNSDYLHDQLAIEFVYVVPPEPWMIVTPLQGTVPGGSNTDLEILFTTQDVDPGLYSGMITVHTNDPQNPRLEIPVDLNVTDGGVSGAPEDILPVSFALERAHPNPFNPTTTIAYALPRESLVRLKVYDLGGRLVRTLVQEDQAAGLQSVVWDGRDNRGRSVPSGTYCYRLEAGTFTETRKMLLVK